MKYNAHMNPHGSPTNTRSKQAGDPRSRPALHRETHPLLRRLGHEIRQLRTEQGWTLRELADAAGLSDRFVSDVEAGRGNASILNLAQIARALGLPVAELLARAETMDQRGIIALLGLRGAGKSTVGQRLAQRLGLPFFELDALIEEASGMALASIFAIYGEEYYRRLELETLQRFIARTPAAVLATGGGIVTSPGAYALLERTCRLVWLKAQPEDHFERVRRQGDDRPMKDNPHAMAELRALLKAREPLYARAHHAIDTSALGIDGSVEALIADMGA
jgi:XRE family aerobic/anaerobic benzoate catabolism transcriptional regulator